MELFWAIFGSSVWPVHVLHLLFVWSQHSAFMMIMMGKFIQWPSGDDMYNLDMWNPGAHGILEDVCLFCEWGWIFEAPIEDCMNQNIGMPGILHSPTTLMHNYMHLRGPVFFLCTSSWSTRERLLEGLRATANVMLAKWFLMGLRVLSGAHPGRGSNGKGKPYLLCFGACLLFRWP